MDREGLPRQSAARGNGFRWPPGGAGPGHTATGPGGGISPLGPGATGRPWAWAKASNSVVGSSTPCGDKGQTNWAPREEVPPPSPTNPFHWVQYWEMGKGKDPSPSLPHA